jgi:hypothetical protein
MEDNKLNDFPGRYNAFLKEYGITPTDLAERIQDTPAKYYKYGKKDGPSPNLETIEKILAAFPDLSSEWLLRGEGVMRKSKGETVVSKPVEVDALRQLEAKFEKMYRGILESQQDHIGSLKAMLKIGSFLEVNRDTTDDETPEGRVLMHPATHTDIRRIGFPIPGEEDKARA